MKKSIFILLVTIGLVSLMVVNCSKSSSGGTTTVDTVKVALAKISGTVTLPDQSNAAGGIVTISSSPNATNVVSRIVVDATGTYTTAGLPAGTYYLSAKYNTTNTNLKSSGFTFTTSGETTKTVGLTDVSQNLTLVSNAGSGSDVIEYSATVVAGKWLLDETHSRIGFEFPFDSVNAVFNGHFNNFGITTFKFDQATPANSQINVWVDITSTETGAPTIIDTVNKKTLLGGRDGLNGCITHTFGVVPAVADTFYKNIYRPTSILSGGNLILSASASFVSTSVATYGDGYVANGNLTFHGFTKPVALYFHYIKGYSATANGVTHNYCSFSGFFDMKAKGDFSISSTHVKGNPVHVITDIQFNQ